jgi:pectinesterase
MAPSGRIIGLVATLILLLASLPALNSLGAEQPKPKDGSTHIVLVGDSTVTDNAGWGKSFAACLRDDAMCTNLSRGGRSSSSYREEGLWEKALAMEPDWVLIQFGHNDQPGHPGRENESDKGYRINMERYVDEARAAGVQPVLVTPISRRQWSKQSRGQDRIASTLEPYAKVVKQIAADKQVPLIDLHSHSIEIYESLGKLGCEIISPKKENGQWDGTHFNESGGALFGAVVAMDCRSYIPGISGFFPTSKLSQLQQSHRPAPSAQSPRQLERTKPPVLTSQGSRTLVVAADGTGEFMTIQDAIAAVPSANSDRVTIRIRPGVYTGQIVVPADKPNVTFDGDNRESTIVTYALTVHDPIPPGVPANFNGYGVIVLADGFQANDVTFRQLAGDHGQAIALYIIGNRATIDDCRLVGWQDTLRVDGNGLYFHNCYVEGRVDFIYGDASALFDTCAIHTKGEGYVTAASTPAEKPWGLIFVDCTLSGTGKHRAYLGRPWRPHASVTFVNCNMDDSIKSEGWQNWGNPDNERTARYSEFHSTVPYKKMQNGNHRKERTNRTFRAGLIANRSDDLQPADQSKLYDRAATASPARTIAANSSLIGEPPTRTAAATRFCNSASTARRAARRT